jgi:hypothetical protein
MSTCQEITQLPATGLKFLHGCFTRLEWEYLKTQREFLDRLAQISSPDDAEPLVLLGLTLLEREPQLGNFEVSKDR